MPQINVREKDYSAPAATNYSNFTVVVPGFISKSVEDVFDENGIYEESDLDLFKEKVGCVGEVMLRIGAEAVAPTLDETIKHLALNEENFKTWRDAGCLYLDSENETGEIGKLKDEAYVYTLVGSADAWIDDANYTVIAEGNEGSDAKSKISSYGNQIAYELIKAGYTVMYMNLGVVPTTDEEKEAVVAKLASSDFWDVLKDRASYDFRYIISGLDNCEDIDTDYVKMYGCIADVIDATQKDGNCASDTADGRVRLLTDGRGDAVALIDIPSAVYCGSSSQTAAVKAIHYYTIDKFNSDTFGKYVAFFVPTVTYSTVDSISETDFLNNTTFPASVHYLLCAIYARQHNFDEWFAVAGYNRGVCKYTVSGTGYKFGEVAMNQLEPRFCYNYGTSLERRDFKKAVNVIAKIRGNYYM